MKRKISVIISSILALSFVSGQIPGFNTVNAYADEQIIFEEESTAPESIESVKDILESELLLHEEISEQEDKSEIADAVIESVEDIENTENVDESDETEELVILDEESEPEYEQTPDSDEEADEEPALFTDVVLELTEANFANYFEKGVNDLAYFKDGVSPDKIKISNSIDGKNCLDGIKGIYINQSVEITAEESATLSGIYLDIRAENVKVNGVAIVNTGTYGICINNADNVSINSSFVKVETEVNAEGYAIYAYNSDNLTIDGCAIEFKGNTDGEEKVNSNAAVYVSGDNIVNGLKFKNNNVDAQIPSSYVPWVEVPSDSGNWVGIPVSNGLYFNNCSKSDILENFISVVATDKVGSYDTVYGMYINGSNAATKDTTREADIVIKENSIVVKGKTYVYGISIAYCDYFISDNIIYASSDTYFANAIDISYGETGIITKNIVGAEYTDEEYKNEKTDNGLTYGIYAYWYEPQAGDVTITDNYVITTSYCSVGIANNIQLDAANTCAIGKNRILVNGQYTTGIASFSLNDLYITDNYIASNGGNTGDLSMWTDFGIATRGIYVAGRNDNSHSANILRNLVTSTDAGIICESASYIEFNGVIAKSDYAIDVLGDVTEKTYYSDITYNVLFAKEAKGDEAVKYVDTIDDNYSNIGYPQTSLLEVGKPLSDSVLSDGYDGFIGTFEWCEPEIVPERADNRKTEYDVKFTPYNSQTGESLTTMAIITLDVPFYVEGLTDRVYTGSKITFDNLEVYSSEYLLEQNKDYTLTYINNVNVGTATIIVKGKGNYKETEEVTFNIIPADISGEEFEADDIYLIDNGKDQKKTPVLKMNGKTVASSNYSLKYCEEGTTAITENPKEVNSYATSYVILITAKENSNFVGTRAVNVSIRKDVILLSKVTVSLDKKDGKYSIAEYGNDVRPVVTVKKGDVIYENGKDYYVSFYNNKAPGKGYLVVTGKGDKLTGQKKVYYNIVGIPIKSVVVSGITDKRFTYNTEDGVEQTDYVVKTEKETLTEGKDFEVQYISNKKPGTASIVFTGIGNYTGTKKVSFKIQKGVIEKENNTQGNYILADESAEYTKGGTKTYVSVVADDCVLNEGVDYTIKYSGNTGVTNGKTAKAIIKGKGYFATEKPIEINFEVIQKVVTDGDGSFEVTAVDKNLKSGKASKVGKLLQVPKIKDAVTGKSLVKATDFDPEISYFIGVDPDSMEAISTEDKAKDFGDYFKELFPGSKYEETGAFIKAQYKLSGYYSGFYSVTYRVADSKISSAKAAIADVTYTGAFIEFDPASDKFANDFVIYVGKYKNTGTILKYGTDYEIVPGSYANNNKKGTATVVIKGIGKYSGTKKVSFKIVSKKL